MSLTVRLPRRRIQILISTNGRNEGLLGVARRRRQEGLKRARFRGTPSETPRHAEESLVVCPLASVVSGPVEGESNCHENSHVMPSNESLTTNHPKGPAPCIHYDGQINPQ